MTATRAPREVDGVTRDNAQKGRVAFSYDGKWLIFALQRDGRSDQEPLVKSVAFAGQMYGEMYAYRMQAFPLVMPAFLFVSRSRQIALHWRRISK